jgi:hypothetical protein
LVVGKANMDSLSLVFGRLSDDKNGAFGFPSLFRKCYGEQQVFSFRQCFMFFVANAVAASVVKIRIAPMSVGGNSGIAVVPVISTLWGFLSVW